MSRVVQRDFFISYTSADSRWAEWIAWQLEEAGYSVVLQAWDFRPGANFVSEMERAIANAKRTIAVLSPQYLNALYTQPEWAAAFRRDPKGEQGILIPVCVHECEVTGLLGQIIYVDLKERDEVSARKVLLAGVRHERAKPEVAPAFPERVEHTISKHLRFPGDFPIVWSVPYPRNPLFVGREQVLKDLHSTLSTKHQAALISLSAESDPGTIGTRETAVEYVYRYRSDYRVILWARASSRQTLISDFISMASMLNLPEKIAYDQDHIVSSVKSWLQTQTHWLLVLDNAQDTELIKEFVLPPNQGHLLLTTQVRSVETLVPLVEIDNLKPEEQTLLVQLSRVVGATLRSSQRWMPLGIERVTIGRTADNQVMLNDPSVSSHHAEILLKEHGYWITDLGSINGTFVNQRRLDQQAPYLLHPGNVIRIGNTIFMYEVNATPTGELSVPPIAAPANAPSDQAVRPTPSQEINVGERVRAAVGQQLGNYRLVRLLGQGGFAEVYLGEHMHLGTQAAIKVLSTKLAGDDIEHFRLEARTIARLVHPHIVRVLDFDVEGTTPFLVMDYAPNGTLRQRYPKGDRLRVESVVSYVKQVALALQYAHDQKVIHRDIKPENMLVSRTGEILLSDFGIALIAQSSHYQNLVDAAGTIAYMAPEQIESHPRPASDQYSLGIVAYEWISGDRPFHGSLTEIAIKHNLVPPPSLCEQVPELPPAVEQVVLRALAKDPEQRFASVQAFATALEQASQIAGPPDAASPPPALGRTSPKPSSVQPIVDGPSPTPTPPSDALFPTEKPPVESSTTATQHQPSVSESSTPVPGRTLTALPQPSAQRQGLSRSKMVLLIGMVLLVIAGSVGLFSLVRGNQIATDNTKATATSAAATIGNGATTSTVAYPNIMGNYSGTIHNDWTNQPTTMMKLTINQNQGFISGNFTVYPPLMGSGPFTGSIDINKMILFIVNTTDVNPPANIKFYGTLQPDASLSGHYCSVNPNNDCDTSYGGYGTWSVTPQ